MAEYSDPDVAYSINDVPIRLTPERWRHKVDRHHELSDWRDACLTTVSSPDTIVGGHGEALIAIRQVGEARWLAVIYVETHENDGFNLTAYRTRRANWSEVILRRR